MHILVVQNRSGAMQRHEQECLVEAMQLPASVFTFVSAKRQPLTTLQVEDYDAVIFAGAGEDSVVTEKPAFLESMVEFVWRVRSKDIPMFGIQYGAHILTIAFGGKVCRKSGLEDVGTVEMVCISEAKTDPVFRYVPERFLAQIDPRDCIETMPEGGTTLVTSHDGKPRSWVIKGEPIYATEMHVDLNSDRLAERLVFYRDDIESVPGGLEHAVLTLKDTPAASKILPLFIDRIVRTRQHA